MFALEIASALVKPSAGVIDQTGGIIFFGPISNISRIKLPPALIKGSLDGDGDDIVEGVNHALILPSKLVSVLFASASQPPITTVIPHPLE